MTESIRASSLTLSPAALAGYIANQAEALRESAAQLEAERDEQLVKWKKLETDLTTEVFALRTERDDLKSEVAAREYNNEQVQRLNKRLASTRIPRIITAEELKADMWVAAQFQSNDWTAGVTTRNSADELVLVYSVPGSSHRSRVKNFKAFVLLADAPPQEPEPVTAEDIRQSEPGSTFDDNYEGIPVTWEWNGEKLRAHSALQTMHSTRHTPEDIVSKFGPLTRSTAEPRGDYPKRLSGVEQDNRPPF